MQSGFVTLPGGLWVHKGNKCISSWKIKHGNLACFLQLHTSWMSNRGTFYNPTWRQWLQMEILILQASRIHLRFVIHYAEMRLYLSALVTTWLNHAKNWKCDSSTQVDYKKTRHVEFSYKRMKKPSCICSFLLH